MASNTRFILTSLLLLVVAWLLSGERLLDAAFNLPDLGPLDDAAILFAVWLEDVKAPLGLPDVFGAVRAGLHAVLGV